MPKNRLVAAYVPVLHRGYLQFFQNFSELSRCFVFGLDLLKKIDYLRKDLRALSPSQQAKVIKALKVFEDVAILNPELLMELDNHNNIFIMPDEDVSRAIAGGLKKAKVEFYPIFLRWDRRTVESLNQIDPDETISDKQFQQRIMKQAMQKATQSSDLWRRVGAVLITNDNKVVGLASNQGEPTPHSPWMEGDPRNIFNRGVAIEMSIFTHAEAALIAEAAKRGLKLEGGAIYVTDFPCPACAKLIAHSGLSACYYKDGYSVLDGKRVMQEYGVKLVRVVVNDISDNSESTWIVYKNR